MVVEMWFASSGTCRCPAIICQFSHLTISVHLPFGHYAYASPGLGTMWLQSNRTRTEITEPILDCRFRCCIARWQRANGHAACEQHARRHGRRNRCGSWSSTGRTASCMNEDPVASIPISCRLFASEEGRNASRSGAPAWTAPIRGRGAPNGTSSPCYAWQWRHKKYSAPSRQPS